MHRETNTATHNMKLLQILYLFILFLVMYLGVPLYACQTFVVREAQQEFRSSERVHTKETQQQDAGDLAEGGQTTSREGSMAPETCCQSYHRWALQFPDVLQAVYAIATQKEKIHLTAEAGSPNSLRIGTFSASWNDHAGLVMTFSSSGHPLSVAAATGVADLGFGIALHRMALDPTGQHMYVVGATRGVHVWFGSTQVRAQSRGHRQDSDVLIGKLSTATNSFQWGLGAGGDYTKPQDVERQSDDIAYDAVVAQDGFLYVSGIYTEPSSFGGTNLSGSGTFLAKVDPKGQFLWTKPLPSTSVGRSLGIDHKQRIFQASLFRGTMKAGRFTEQGPTDIVAIVQWDQQGGVSSVQTIRGMTKESSLSNPQIVVHPSGEITVVGELQGKAQFGSLMVESNQPTMYIARIGPTGSFLWVHKLSFSIINPRYSMVATKQHVYLSVVEYWQKGNSSYLELCNASLEPETVAMLLLKIDTKGKCIWARKATSVVWPVAIALSPDEQFLYITGHFKGETHLGGQLLQAKHSFSYASFLWKMSTVP